MNWTATFRAMRIAVLAVVFALLVGQCLGHDFTRIFFNPAHKSIQPASQKPDSPSEPVRV